MDSKTIFISENSIADAAGCINNCIADDKLIFFLCDENTAIHCLPVIKNKIVSADKTTDIVIAGGEKNKSLQSIDEICRQMIVHNADRNSLLVMVGGGVICDMGGFAASCFKRGIDFILIPTTLLAMCDAAIGAKTAVNIGGYKNQAGSFSFPKSTFIYTPFLQTCHNRNLTNGFAEMLKHGLIADKLFFEELAVKKHFTSAQAIKKSIEIKLTIASADLHEKAERKLLNFGHTIGHAIESLFQNHQENQIMHGEAVAAGIICETFISTKKENLSREELKRVTQILLSFFPKIKQPFTTRQLMPYLLADKKNTNGKINFSLLQNIGTAKYNCMVDADTIEESVVFYNNL